MRAISDALPVVLLHGIGSGAASWVQQFEVLGATRRVLAWDAPGYGASTPVAPSSPAAADYAARLNDWLDALGIERCVLVGHSLGAIIAGAFAAAHPQRVSRACCCCRRRAVTARHRLKCARRNATQRLAMLAELGPQGLAEQRSANMLSAHASDEARAWVRWNMSRVIPHGYAQATHLLANADLAGDLTRYHRPHQRGGRRRRHHHAAGSLRATSRKPRAPSLQVVPRAGHAGYIEAPAAYTAIIDTFCRASDGQRSQ